jgi:hypothetical protein
MIYAAVPERHSGGVAQDAANELPRQCLLKRMVNRSASNARNDAEKFENS